jgi:hypothetical protein
MPEIQFSHQHPTFGTEKNPRSASYWRRSVYYWWFEYLKRNEDYRRTCERQGVGKCAKLYQDFGDIHSLTFRQWWRTNERGAKLFGEPYSRSITILTEAPDRWDFGANLVLEVPLNQSKTYLIRKFRQILKKHHEGKRGRRHTQTSYARYKVVGKVDVNFLEIALQVWDFRKANPKMPLWEIGNELRVSHNNIIREADPPAVRSDKKNRLAATVSRYYRKADEMIKRSVSGHFPH